MPEMQIPSGQQEGLMPQSSPCLTELRDKSFDQKSGQRGKAVWLTLGPWVTM